MTEQKLRWGVLSTAAIGRSSVNPAIQASANGELLAISSRDAGRAQEFAKQHGIPRAHGSYEALLEDDEIDAVYIPLPNGLHREWSIKAAQAGKHVLCEKPLALDPAECEEMIAAAEDNDVLLMEAFMYRFHPLFEKANELVKSGVLGRLRMLRSAFSFPLNRPGDIRFDPALGGGALMDVGCYCVNVSRTLAGAEPEAVWAAANWNESGVDDQLAGTLRFPGGLIAQFDCAFTLGYRCEYQAVGDAAYLDVPVGFRAGVDQSEILEQRGGEPPVRHTITGDDSYRLMVEHFADCALNGRPLRYPASEGMANMRVISALLESARKDGEVVRL